VDPIAALDTVEYTTFPYHYQKWNPGCGNYSDVGEVQDWNLSQKQIILAALYTFIWPFQANVGLTEVTATPSIILSIS
jgi:hypothetical protein